MKVKGFFDGLMPILDDAALDQKAKVEAARHALERMIDLERPRDESVA